ncbi:hypothetical protein VCHENC02_2617B, partial [Vibrio harveyi]
NTTIRTLPCWTFLRNIEHLHVLLVNTTLPVLSEL